MNPVFYIDTNVIRDCIKRRKTETIVAIDYIKENRWKCYTSIFALMEESDIEKDFNFFNKKVKQGMEINEILRMRNSKDLGVENLDDSAEKIQEFIDQYEFVEIQNIVSDTSWNKAVTASKQSNISSSDIIHLVTAGESKCDILLTSDEFFIKEGREFLNKIKEKTPIFCKPIKKEILSLIQQNPNQNTS